MAAARPAGRPRSDPPTARAMTSDANAPTGAPRPAARNAAPRALPDRACCALTEASRGRGRRGYRAQFAGATCAANELPRSVAPRMSEHGAPACPGPATAGGGTARSSQARQAQHASFPGRSRRECLSTVPPPAPALPPRTVQRLPRARRSRPRAAALAKGPRSRARFRCCGAPPPCAGESRYGTSRPPSHRTPRLSASPRSRAGDRAR